MFLNATRVDLMKKWLFRAELTNSLLSHFLPHICSLLQLIYIYLLFDADVTLVEVHT